MNYFDIITGILLILAIIKGFKNGLIIELASLAALVLGLFGAIKFSSITETYLMEHIDSSHIGLIAFIVTFIAIVIGVHLVAKVVDKLVSAIALGMVNRVLGAIFSLLKYAFIISVIIAILGSFEKTYSLIPEEQKSSSHLYEPLKSIAPSIFPYLQFNEVREQIDNARKGVDV
ncbi:CvpA family protein [Carboxylicivirga mesophila]|uniref:CvpA family protein n=2 Tax=Carboxylicivirga TaxID=1628153 RepID=A0A941F2D0_9BACT|nr:MULTISPECIES: CvpA family protein [Carboxylicivirga]MBR8535082.1 CvpA family protein [Carboxylicivirga sediminis]MBS2209930.1 CvpA family protein [Carboxylicivirga mesophila]